jgi:hypothetical protein
MEQAADVPTVAPFAPLQTRLVTETTTFFVVIVIIMKNKNIYHECVVAITSKKFLIMKLIKIKKY